VIPTIIVQALRHDVIEIGSTMPTRDFNFVEDIAEGFVLAGFARDAVGEVFNLGTGEEHSVQEVIETVSTILGVELLVHQRSERMRPPSSEVHRLIADSTKAARRLGWTPRHTFRRGLEETIQWYEVHEQAVAHVHSL
jgi:nucleoside-diphosphate-sugar epimerase